MWIHEVSCFSFFEKFIIRLIQQKTVVNIKDKRYQCLAFLFSGFKLQGRRKYIESLMTNPEVKSWDGPRNPANRLWEECWWFSTSKLLLILTWHRD